MACLEGERPREPFAQDRTHGDATGLLPTLAVSGLLNEADSAVREIAVTAHGFSAHPRIEHVAKLGGDGRMHEVPVPWTEYLPVQNTARLALCEAPALSEQEFRQQPDRSDAWREFFQNWRTNPQQAVLRRAIVSALDDHATPLGQP